MIYNWIYNLQITFEAKKVVDFLDIKFNLKTAIHKPYKKPNNNLTFNFSASPSPPPPAPPPPQIPHPHFLNVNVATNVAKTFLIFIDKHFTNDKIYS